MILVIIILLLLAIYIKNCDAYYIINTWNWYMDSVRNQQNKTLNLTDASQSSVVSIKKLNSLIVNHHNQILNEVKTLMNKGYNGVPMNEIDQVQQNLTKGSTKWSPIWVKFIDTWAGTSDQLPTLKKIVQEVGDDILLLHVSVFNPGTKLPYHKGISKSVWRYHYGLEIPEGDVGLEVEGVKHKWQNGVGFIWDDTLAHKAWNLTDQIRLIIFADVFREMNPVYKYLSKLIHRLTQATKHVKSISDRLKREGVQID
jgi:hypothetical protein